MTVVATGKVAKKRALYPPKEFMDEIGLKEGNPVKYRIEDEKLVVEPVLDPIDLAIKSKKWGKTSVDEFERESETEQGKLYG